MAERGVLVGVDFGTTACKAGVVDLAGVELAHASVPTPWREVSTGAELDPQAIVDTAVQTVGRALADSGDAPVVGLGVTGMAETGVLLDDADQPVVPAIAWHDSRGGPEAAHLGDELGADRFTGVTGLPPNPLCTASKYLWLRRNEPATKRGRRWLNVAEWIVHRLGGRQATELSLASRTAWLDQHTRAPWSASLEVCGAPADLLPERLPAGDPWGTADATLPRLRGAVLTVAGHDHLCGAVGAGAVGDGDLYDSCGTAEALIGQLPPPVDATEIRRLVDLGVTVGSHVLPGRHALLGAQRAGMVLQRYLDLLGADRDGRRALEEATVALSDSGGIAIDDDEGEEATITGIGRFPDPAQVWFAALDLVMARTTDIVRAMETATGPTRRLVVAGGWARGVAYRARKRAHLGEFTYAGSVTEAGVRGAALLGGLAAQAFPSIDTLPSPSEEP